MARQVWCAPAHSGAGVGMVHAVVSITGVSLPRHLHRGSYAEGEFLVAWHESVERERAMVIDIRRLIDWAEARPEIDADRIGLIGFSHSAMLAATLAVNEPRIAATVLVFGGARPHEIVARCDGLRTSGLREKVAREFGWSLEEYERRLEPIFRVMDPAQYPARVDPASVLLFEAEEVDDAVRVFR